MKRIDLDDLPPKLAALLTGLEPGEAVILVRDGAVVGRLSGAAPAGEASDGETPSEAIPEERAREIFEQFRSMVEDDF